MTRARVLLMALLALIAQGSGPALAADTVPAAGGPIEITPLIHSSIQIEHGGKVIQVDPWSMLDLARYKKADLILITDDPVHHLDVKAIQQLRPAFLRQSGPISFVNGNAGLTHISLDFGPLQPLSQLSTLNVLMLYEIRYLEPNEAQGRFGIADGGPVIVLLTRQQ